MGEASIRAEGASSNALGGCGFVEAAESDDTRAKLFRAFSTHLACRAATAPNGAKSTPRVAWTGPPSLAHEEGSEKYAGVKKGC
jgi:hypothetical protein